MILRSLFIKLKKIKMIIIKNKNSKKIMNLKYYENIL